MHFFKKLHLVLVWYSKVSCVSFRSPVLTFAQWAGVIYNRLLLEIKPLAQALRTPSTRWGEV